MNWKNRILTLPAIAAIVILAARCSDSDSGSEAVGPVGEPVSGGTVVIAEGADMTIPISLISESTLDGNLGGDVMFMELLRPEWEAGELVFRTADQHAMALARSYEYVGADSAALRFHMRSDVKWSDGTPLTARDVVFTYTIVGDPDLASSQQNYVDFLDSVVAENDSTVLFSFSRRYADMITHMALPLLPEHIFGDTPAAEFRNHPKLLNPENGNMVVSGPYMIGSWERGSRIILVRNPQFQPAAYLDQVVIRIIPDAVTKIVELQNGTVDFLQAITLDQVPMIREQAKHVRIVTEDKRFYDYIGYNGSKFAPFQDPDIRRALGLAVDVPGIIAALQMTEFAVPAGGPYAPILTDLYDPQGQAPLRNDTTEAKRVLAAKGWRDSDGDGILDRNGQPFRFTVAVSNSSQRRQDVMQIVQQQWRRIGVDARIQPLEFNTLTDNLQAGNFEAVVAGWSVALYPDLSTLWSPGTPYNFTRYENPQVTTLIDQALQQESPEAAIPIWRQAATLIVKDQPYTWLYYLDGVDGLNERVQGARIDTYGPLQNLWEWWVPENRRTAGESGAAGASGSS